MHKRNESRAGFTIVELLVVVVVIAILAAITVVAYSNFQNRAYDSAIQNDLNGFAKKIHLLAAETGDFPNGGGSSSGGNSSVFPGVTFAPSKQAYFTGNGNLLYCLGAETSGGPLTFQILARSKSGNTFRYRSSGGMQNLGSVGLVANLAGACLGMGDPRSFSYGFRPDLQVWNSWTEG